MKYILMMYQPGGCDYTIGCGYLWTTFDASSLKEATDKAVIEVEEYGGSEIIEEAELLEYKNVVDIMELIEEKEEQEQAELEEQQAKKTEEQERELLAELKAKYE